MAGYVVADLRVTDPAAFETYRRQVGATVELYGGRFLVRGGNPLSLEGGWQPERFVIIEFETVDRARAWYDSPEYSSLLKLRQSASEGGVIIVDGV
ncbi:MAG: hypothetical protein JWO42_685 [Chloroflexi bacterium]|jgi:uncharacterized protein (DUF1330 family)|nr:hypothetical protein [Chloroflexota bacterium]